MNKKIIWGIVIVAIVIVGALAFTKLNESKWDNKVDSKAQLDLMMDDWKTYTNTNLAYEIKYPSDWKINEGTVNSGKDIEIYADNNPASVKISSMASEQCVEKPWELKVAYSVETTKCFKDTKGNTIKISAGFGKDSFKEKIEKIISTFKFTSSATTIQSKDLKHFTWRGISFDYPSTWNAKVWRYGSPVREAEGKLEEVGFQITNNGMEVIQAGGPQSWGDTCATLKLRTTLTKCVDIKYAGGNIVMSTGSGNVLTQSVFDQIVSSIIIN